MSIKLCYIICMIVYVHNLPVIVSTVIVLHKYLIVDLDTTQKKLITSCIAANRK